RPFADPEFGGGRDDTPDCERGFIVLVIGTSKPNVHHGVGFGLDREIVKYVRHKRRVDELFLERDAVSRVVDRLDNRLPHQSGRTYAAIEWTRGTQLSYGRNADAP